MKLNIKEENETRQHRLNRKQQQNVKWT